MWHLPSPQSGEPGPHGVAVAGGGGGNGSEGHGRQGCGRRWTHTDVEDVLWVLFYWGSSGRSDGECGAVDGGKRRYLFADIVSECLQFVVLPPPTHQVFT